MDDEGADDHRKRYEKKYYKDNREKILEQNSWAKQRGAYLYRTYGIHESDYDRMLDKQDGGCAICGVIPEVNKNLSVDHCHATGVVRGLLCANCNTSLGRLGDSIPILQRAIKYLRKHEPTKHS